jgi:hypothetical protein
MSLKQRINDAVSGSTVSVSSHAERVETKFVPSVPVTLHEEDGNIVKLFLPRCYGDTFEDADLADINTRQLQYYLIYKGKISVSNTLILDGSVMCTALLQSSCVY